VQKQAWDTTGPQVATLVRWNKKLPINFSIKETM
jgi:hypothetical protein